MKKSLLEIQQEVIAKHHVKIEEHSKCRERMHVHIKERKICKWVPKNSLRCTFDLFHEIGHIETTRSGMRRAEEEYFASCWAIECFNEYGLTVPDSVLHIYQRYVLQEVARGKRRGGTGYSEMNLYKYAGIDKSIEQFKKELAPEWAAVINDWV